MKKKIQLLTFIMSTLFMSLGAQEDNCSTVDVPMPEDDQKAYVKAMTEDREKYRMNGDSVIIPVVVHNMHWNHVGYVSDKTLLETLDKMNDALANRGQCYDSLGVDTGIRLCRAGVDPYGNPTTGILHHHNELAWNGKSINTSGFFTPEIQWDTSRYFNIYVADSHNGVSLFPWFEDSSGFDGIVVHTSYVTLETGIDVFMHEIGHYLGLYHTVSAFYSTGDCEMEWCLGNDDRVCDTPPERFAYNPNFPINSCNTDVNLTDPNNVFLTDQLDMRDNYLSGGRWRTRYTHGQVNRMFWTLDYYRPNLTKLVENRCATCSAIPVEADIPVQEQLLDHLFTVNNTSEGEFDFNWYVNEELVSIERSLAYIPQTSGHYLIRLEAKTEDISYCGLVWSWEQVINFKCRASINITEPKRYFKDSCYVIKTEGMEDLEWWTDYAQGKTIEINFCPSEDGVQPIVFQYGQEGCSEKDTLWVNVEDITQIELDYWRGSWFEEDDKHTPLISRTRKWGDSKLVFLGRDVRSRDKLKHRTFFRFMEHSKALEEEWQWYYPDSVVSYFPNDFIVDKSGVIYTLGKLAHPNGRNGKYIIARINRLGKVDWCKRINMPNHRQYLLPGAHIRTGMTFENENILLTLAGYYIKINKNGHLQDAYSLNKLPYDKYEEHLFNNAIIDISGDKEIVIWDYDSIVDFDLYEDYAESVSDIYLPAFMLATVSKANKEVRYKYHLLDSGDIHQDCLVAKSHPKGLIGYWKDSYHHNFALYNKEMNVVWHKRFREDFTTPAYTRDADVFVSAQGDIYLFNTVDKGKFMIFIHLDKDGNLINKYVLKNNQESTVSPENHVWSFHESGLKTNDGFLISSTVLTDTSAYLALQHLPIDMNYIVCDTIGFTLEEVTDFTPLTESYIQEELTITPVEVSLQDAELYIRKGTFETEVWCEASYPLEDYSLQIQDTTYNCPDNMTITLELCRKKSAIADTISLVQYPLSPLDTITSPSELREVIFEIGQSCVREEWTTSVGDHHFMVNTRLDYLTPYTLEASFFDAHEKFEFEYRNNYVLVEGDCQMVSTSNMIESSKLKIYPNPTSNNLHIELDQGIIQKVYLYTVLGELLQQTVLGASKGTLSVGQFTDGIYLLEVQTKSGQRYWRKVIVQ